MMAKKIPAYSMRVFWSDPDEGFIAVCPELGDLSAFGTTHDEAVRELRKAIVLAVEVLKEDGEPVPEPSHRSAFSGQFRLRVPKSLHAALVRAAEEEDVSLNTFVTQVLSEKLGERAGARGSSRRLAPSRK